MQPQPYAETNQPMQVLSTQFIIVMLACWLVPLSIITVFFCLAQPVSGPDASIRVRHIKRETGSTKPSEGRRHISLMPVKPD